MSIKLETTVKLDEVLKQEYSNCTISAGFATGAPNPADTMYIKLDRPAAGKPLIVLVRPDEAAALAWCLTGVLWSLHIQEAAG